MDIICVVLAEWDVKCPSSYSSIQRWRICLHPVPRYLFLCQPRWCHGIDIPMTVYLHFTINLKPCSLYSAFSRCIMDLRVFHKYRSNSHVRLMGPRVLMVSVSQSCPRHLYEGSVISQHRLKTRSYLSSYCVTSKTEIHMTVNVII